MFTKKTLAVLAMLASASGLFAQGLVTSPPQNIVQLSATATVEVQQDFLTLTMNTVRDGADANAVQTQLKAALDAALSIAKANASPGQLEVRTGNFGLYPRYGKDNKPIGWQGSAELILQGRDIARISTTAGKIQTLTLGNVGFGLSREQRAKVEGDAQTQAIARFKAKAADIARDFGFGGYTLREVSVNANDQGYTPGPRVMAMQSKALAADAPVPVEAGQSTVAVTVTGSVQLK
jgi:predicted secreted protein